MDYYMPPGMNGSDAALKIRQILKQNNCQSVIACVTSQTEEDFVFNKSLKNFDYFFSKPIAAKSIRSVMEELFVKNSSNPAPKGRNISGTLLMPTE